MSKDEAYKILQKLIDLEPRTSVKLVTLKFKMSPYPQIADIYEDYISGKISHPGTFRDKAVHCIQISDTKLYKAMK